MSRIFYYLICFVVLCGAGGYLYLTQTNESKAQQVDVYKSEATKIAGDVSELVKNWRVLVIKLSDNPSVINGLPSVEGGLQVTWADQQKDAYPELTSLRVLVPGHLDIDRSSNPPLGYAGLGLLRAVESTKKIQMPEVHLRGSAEEHVAISAPVIQEQQLKAIVLATFDVKSLFKVFKGKSSDVLFELKQGALVIQAIGDKSQKHGTSVEEVFIPGTRWRIAIKKAFPEFPFTEIDVLFYSGVLLALIVFFGVVVGVFTNGERSKALLDKVSGNRLEDDSKSFDEAVGKAEDTIDKEMEALELTSTETTNPIFLKNDAIQLGVESEVPKSIFRAYDIRGVVDDTLTEELVIKIGQAIGSEVRKVGKNQVAIGRDGRLHSLKLSEALAKGLQSSGCDVVDVGQVPTPVLYFATHHIENTTSGVMITGSHNPPEYNGLKIVVDGVTLSNDGILQLYERIQDNNFETGQGSLQKQMMLPDYIGTISADVKVGRMMKVVVDCGNGVAGEAAPMLLSTLGCEVVPLYCDIDGNFPNHHPDPSKPENLKELIDKVREEEAELGLAFDGDGDRLGVVDAAGNIIWPDRQMMLYAADVLSRQAGADIIFDVKCSKNLAKEISRHGGKPVMAKTGHSLIKAKMKETNAELAGEMSGHIFFKERWFGFDDALYTASRLVEILSAEFRSTTEIFAELPDSISTPELNVKMEEGENFTFIEKMQAMADFDDAKVISIDGMRVEFIDGWGLVRASNTTPSLVLRFEADSEEALEIIKGKFRGMMLQVKPDIDLPF